MPGRFRRIAACTLAPFALLAAAPSAVPTAPPAPAADRVYTLARTWSCRTAAGEVVHFAGTRDGESLTVHNEVERAGKRLPFDDRYVFDAAQQRWNVQSGLGGFDGVASPWTADTWAVQGTTGEGRATRMTDELLPGGDVRRTFAANTDGRQWVTFSVERCTAGSTPPPPDACIAERYPPSTLSAPVADERGIPKELLHGVVQVIVSLNERSELVGTRIQSSPSAILNAPALEAARGARFRTAVVNCKPIAADYVFTVRFGP